ncbi:hypothetical protein CASFOL_025718 [Castilleja foliolosa]|uniref:PHD-type domain-containing protein n=1 Tax=Castilleja foliolosa TaxID=1961234 RepID=A0ABD3CUF8_9LAMI
MRTTTCESVSTSISSGFSPSFLNDFIGFPAASLIIPPAVACPFFKDPSTLSLYLPSGGLFHFSQIFFPISASGPLIDHVDPTESPIKIECFCSSSVYWSPQISEGEISYFTSQKINMSSAKNMCDTVSMFLPISKVVYQPSEEELRGYLYPYENVLCSECHHGGDDALMLLCDLCDSPAHTYCVGLGREVPEGSWFCDGCRPTGLLTSPNSQSLNNNYYYNNNPTHPDHGANNNIGSSPVRETFDLNEMYVPETPLTQVNMGQSPTPRYSSGDPIPASSYASTLFERRQLHRAFQLFNNRGTRSERSVAGINLFGSRIVSQQALPVQVAGPQTFYNHNQDYRLYGREGLRQDFNHRESTSTDYYAFGQGSQGELSGIGHQQLHPCNNRSNTGVEVSLASSSSSLNKEQVQSMVKRHLKSLSRNLDLGYNNFKYIARTSTHTILAAVGLEHRWNEVYPVQTRPLTCNHFDSRQQTYPVKVQCSSCFDRFVRTW